MTRTFKTVDYEATLDQTISLREALPANHLVRFVVDLVAQLDLSKIYERYGARGGEPYAPEILSALLFYGYVSGVFSSRRIERATRESLPFRFIAGGLHPDHDTLANFRRTFRLEIKDLFVQVLLLAEQAGYLKLGNISIDGSKVHANASKSKAVSYERLLELEVRLCEQVNQLFTLAEQADQQALPEGMDVGDEIAVRQERLDRLAEAKAVLEARAQERYAAEKAEYDAKMHKRDEKARRSGRKPGGRPPTAPSAGPEDKDQYNFTDPDSRIMKCSQNSGFEQAYNGQVAGDHGGSEASRQASLLIVACSLSNHPNDTAEVEPTLEALPEGLGQPEAAAADKGYWSQPNLDALINRGIDAYIATGREPHGLSWQAWFAAEPEQAPDDATPLVKMAHNATGFAGAELQTKIGKAIYRLRKCTVESVIGIIKEIMGFRQFRLRGLESAGREWSLVCLAFNLKRMHTLSLA